MHNPLDIEYRISNVIGLSRLHKKSPIIGFYQEFPNQEYFKRIKRGTNLQFREYWLLVSASLEQVGLSFVVHASAGRSELA